MMTVFQPCKVYGRDHQFLGELPTAKTSYNLKDIPLDTGKITLPLKDTGNALLAPLNYVDMYDYGLHVGKFRVIGEPSSSIKASGGSIDYKLEHVLATLCDNILPGYFEIGGTDYSLRDCIEYLLSFQTVKRWQLGQCDFDTYFQYTLSKPSILAALLALAKPLLEDYIWTWDTDTYPWTLNLVRKSTKVECEARYLRNMLEINRTVDYADLCTRAWPYGFGEGGVNQLTIREANNGIGYLDADTIGIWGVIEKPFADTTLENAEVLKNTALKWLDEHKNPRYAYVMKAIDVYPVTGEPFDRFYPGKLCRINNQDYGTMVDVRVRQINKPNPESKPADITVTLATNPVNVANELADLGRRAAINELYAQGTTCIWQDSKSGNADANHPIRFKIPIEPECHRINKFRVLLEFGPYRADSRAAAAGGGGVRTSGSGGYAQVTESQRVTSYGSATQGAIDGDGNNIVWVEYSGTLTTGGGSSHTHTITNHRHAYPGSSGYTEYTQPGATSEGSHTHSIATHRHYFAHRHSFNVSITIPGFTITFPGHTHDVPLPSHTHDIEYGIYEGPSVQAVRLTVDGEDIPGAYSSGADVDIIQYLRKGDDGRIVRSMTHYVDVTPIPTDNNPDGKAHIDGTVFVMTFLRSQGGGDY